MADPDPDVDLCYQLEVICGNLKMAVHSRHDALTTSERMAMRVALNVLLLRHNEAGELIGVDHAD